jgi:hypothetical protein
MILPTYQGHGIWGAGCGSPLRATPAGILTAAYRMVVCDGCGEWCRRFGEGFEGYVGP